MCAPREGRIPVTEVYEKALALFQDKERWARGYFNYDKNGEKCPWAEGYSFCALGALCFFGGGYSHEAQCCLQRISEHLYGECIQKVNDDDPEGYEKVIKALKFGAELWHQRDPFQVELGASVEQVLGVRLALQQSGLPETEENVIRSHEAWQAISGLLDQCFGQSHGK